MWLMCAFSITVLQLARPPFYTIATHNNTNGGKILGMTKQNNHNVTVGPSGSHHSSWEAPQTLWPWLS